MRHLLACLLATAAAVAQSPLSTGVQPGSTAFVGGLVVTNTNPPPVTQLFDLTVVDPAGITVRQVDVNCNTAAGTTGTLGVWVTPAGLSHQGNQTNPAVWTQVASATRAHTGGRVAFTVTPFFLPAGSYGVALHYVGCNPVYTNPNTPVPPLPPTYSTLEATADLSAARVRASDLVNPFGGTAAGFAPRHANVALHYLSGAVAVDFVGTPTRGASPLTVQFTSLASSGNPGGILAYAWDFDGDGLTDSSLPNPTHVYTQCGSYTVSLTIVDASGAATATKTNYVQTDVVVPDFGNQLVAPNVVQFTDTSSPTPTSWAWDLDGDGQTDSTLPNPVFTYPNGCAEVTVTLAVARACQPTQTLTRRIAVATRLETTFQSGLVIATTSPGGTNFVDVDVLNPLGVTICGLHVNSSVGAGNPVTVNVHQKAGTYVGSVETAAAWRLVGTATATSRGTGQRTFVTFAPPIHLAQGLHGLAIEHVGASPVYTNLGGPQTYGNADLSVTAGLVQAPPIFGPAATSTQYTPRIWNGALHYATSGNGAAAGYGYIGAGCPGSLGVPGNRALSQPVLGGTATLEIDRLPQGLAFFFVGFSRTSSPLGPLPFDLAPFGAPGCPVRVAVDFNQLLVGTGTAASTAIALPNTASLVGVRFFTQALALDPAANALGGVVSDAAALLVGQ